MASPIYLKTNVKVQSSESLVIGADSVASRLRARYFPQTFLGILILVLFCSHVSHAIAAIVVGPGTVGDPIYFASGCHLFVSLVFGPIGLTATFLGELLSGNDGVFPFNDVLIGAIFALINLAKAYILSAQFRREKNQHPLQTFNFWSTVITTALVSAVVANAGVLLFGYATAEHFFWHVLIWALGDITGVFVWVPALWFVALRRRYLTKHTFAEVFDLSFVSMVNANPTCNIVDVHKSVTYALTSVLNSPSSPSTLEATVRAVVNAAQLHLCLKHLSR